ncbi:PH (Pleckstrin Homology) domain-containing protein [Asanoa ferruginea]|uniref:PH (Pleckstrin Homology) domain-containing protein n=1 Tax=Asanoa ferruginea TaxID=53367 RepID=A0A3D9ZKG4_9ACTN|nr:PH domain-containing protein [Asanoa ferruginea]REF97044.1 PH (Pleckstrin Homology) domain-containing protein [Asanoa ferruginea]GIF50524.1 membrane protein [Asanoa ferruginea]
MAFPDDVLTSDERVVLHVHPHWKTLARPILLGILVIAAAVVALIFVPSGIGQLIIAAAALIVLVWLLLRPVLVRQTTHYVFTDQRILLQVGIFNRDRHDIPLSRVNDHSMNQHFVERLLGTGTLVIESAGERGQQVLRDIPQVEKVQTLLYELVTADHDRGTLDEGEMRDIMREHRAAEAGGAEPA